MTDWILFWGNTILFETILILGAISVFIALRLLAKSGVFAVPLQMKMIYRQTREKFHQHGWG